VTERRPQGRELSAFLPAKLFVLRTPLLPIGALEDWGRELEASSASPEALEAALARDRQRLRERLRKWVEDPVVREALFIASPVLDESLPVWLSEPETERGQKVERTLVRYFSRMAGRATPFGLFAGMAMGRIGEATRLRVSGRETLSRHTRLDMDYVCSLVEKVRREPEVRRALRYVPNSSLYRAAGRIRYMEVRYRERDRSYHLVAVEPSPYLEATLEQARGGATVAELAQGLASADPDVSVDEARGFVEELIESQLLVSTWGPPLTGPEPVPFLLEQAREVPALAQVREQLGAIQESLSAIDSSPPGVSPEQYRQVAKRMEVLPVPAELPRLFQVDMFRPAPEATLSRRVTDEMLRAAMALHRLTPRAEPEGTPIDRFRDRFLERYEGRAVPLMEALDEESGIGFERNTGPGAGTGPLLQGFLFPGSGAGGERFRDEPRWRHLLQRLGDVWSRGAEELVLTDEDLQAMEPREPAQLPESFGVAGTVVAESAEAVNRGEFRMVMENVHGPSGAVYLGRFCHGDRALEAGVQEYLRAEEALRPDAIFAEIVHLPQGRHGNVICRPALREHDIVFLGQSGVAPENRIELTDLWVSVEQGRVVLRSKRLGKEVIPRQSNAHNYGIGLGVYRFLNLLRHQGPSGVGFRWGPYTRALYLPRVVYGRTVLSRARWNVGPTHLKAWNQETPAQRFAAMQRFRKELRLPRWVCLKDHDNDLPVDLDNVLCVETFVQLVKNRPSLTLEEFYPGPGQQCVEGSDGRYVNEVVVPFTRREPLPRHGDPATPSSAVRTAATPRTFPPGSEWLYLKLYTGEATADRLLRGTLAAQVKALKARGAVDRYFFLRFGDPQWHVRLRLHGTPARILSEVWPTLAHVCAGTFSEGEGWRLQLDTYEREVERYGGPVGMNLMEEVFCADSEAAFDMIAAYPGDEAAHFRWRLVLRGLDNLLEDLGLPLEEKLKVVERLRANFGNEFRVDKRFEEQLSQRYRRESKELEALLSLKPETAQAAWKPGLAALQRRGARLRELAVPLRRAESEGQLTLPLTRLAESLLHMHVNRMLISDHRAQELILYDFLERLYRSRLARQRKGGAA